MPMPYLSRLTTRLFAGEVDRRVNAALSAARGLDPGWRSLDPSPRDRRGYDRDAVLAEALEAWRLNPLARRIVELTTQYVVGSGVGLACAHPRTHAFLQSWWDHPLNRMPTRLFEWCDELTRSGELFIALSTDAAGMSYVRAVPAIDVAEIETAANDLEQERVIYEKPRLGEGGNQAPSGLLRGRAWPVYAAGCDERLEDGSFPPVMLHYAINRPVGALHGESDLAPLLRWLARYAAWLEDRARLNRFRNAFVYVVKARFRDKAEKLARQAELSAHPPGPGSILVADESEEWSVISPQLASFEAAEDGLALKKMAAAGSGNPLHFLAEPESSTRTTAESAGGPTFRRYQQRQLFFLWMVGDIARAAAGRRRMVDRRLSAQPEIRVSGSDISARDNAELAGAAAAVIAAFTSLRDRGLIDDAELLRLAYRFAGEVVDVEEMLSRSSAAVPLRAGDEEQAVAVALCASAPCGRSFGPAETGRSLAPCGRSSPPAETGTRP